VVFARKELALRVFTEFRFWTPDFETGIEEHIIAAEHLFRSLVSKPSPLAAQACSCWLVQYAGHFSTMDSRCDDDRGDQE